MAKRRRGQSPYVTTKDIGTECMGRVYEYWLHPAVVRSACQNIETDLATIVGERIRRFRASCQRSRTRSQLCQFSKWRLLAWMVFKRVIYQE